MEKEEIRKLMNQLHACINNKEYCKGCLTTQSLAAELLRKRLETELHQKLVQKETTLDKDNPELVLHTPLGRIELKWFAHPDNTQALYLTVYGRNCKEIRSDCYTGTNYVTLRLNPEFEDKKE